MKIIHCIGITFSLLLMVYSLSAQELNLVLQTGHAGKINQIKFDPTDKLIASAGADNLVILWDVIAARQLRSYYLHQGAVNDLDFHPNQKWIASGGDDRKLIIWEYPSGKIIEEVGGFETPIERIRYSKDGKYIIVSTKTIYKITVADDYKVESTTFDAVSRFNALAISPNDKYIAFGGEKDAQVKVVDFESLKVQNEFKLSAYDLKFSRSDDLFFGAGGQKMGKFAVKPSLGRRLTYQVFSDVRWHSFKAITYTDKYLIGAAKMIRSMFMISKSL